MFKKKTIALFTAITLILSYTIQVFAGHVGTGGNAPVPGNAKTGQASWISDYYGTKLSLIILEKGAYYGDNEEEPALVNITPHSAYLDKDYPVPVGGGLTGIAPLYFLGNAPDSNEEVSWIDASGSSTKVYHSGDLGNAVVYGADSYVFDKPGEQELCSQVTSVFRGLTWNTGVPENKIEGDLGLGSENASELTNEQKEKRREVVTVIAKMMRTTYKDSSNEYSAWGSILDAVVNELDNIETGGQTSLDYVILIEPLTAIKVPGDNVYRLITPYNYLTSLYGGDLSDKENMQDAIDAILGAGAVKTSNENSGLGWVRNTIVGKINGTELTDQASSGNSIASMIYYTGPKTARKNSSDYNGQTFFDKSNKKWGFGTIFVDDGGKPGLQIVKIYNSPTPTPTKVIMSEPLPSYTIENEGEWKVVRWKLDFTTPRPDNNEGTKWDDTPPQDPDQPYGEEPGEVEIPEDDEDEPTIYIEYKRDKLTIVKVFDTDGAHDSTTINNGVLNASGKYKATDESGYKMEEWFVSDHLLPGATAGGSESTKWDEVKGVTPKGHTGSGGIC